MADQSPAVETLAARALAAELRATWHERYLVDGHDPLGEYGPDQARAVAGDILASDWLATHTLQAVDAKLGEVEQRIVRDWLDDDEQMRVPDTEWGHALYQAITDLVARGGEDRG